MPTLLKRAGLGAALLIVLIGLPGAATATTGPGVAAIPGAFRYDLYDPADLSKAAPERCAERTSPDGGRAYICMAYEPFTFDGQYVSTGYYRGTLYGATFVQIRHEDGPQNLITRPDFRGIWYGWRVVQFRACLKVGDNAPRCGNWS